MGIERAADIIAASLTSEEKTLLLDCGRGNAVSAEGLTEVFRSLVALRLIEEVIGGSKLVVTRFGREVLTHLVPPYTRH